MIIENNFTKSYLELNKKLVRTLVIKSEISAELINDQLIRLYGRDSVDLSEPGTWKYYKNIAGEYHEKDTPMSVTSLDTLQEIPFTKEMLEIHTTTRYEYAYDTRYYNQLIATYPDQEQLILGILYPVDKQKAIEAENGSILGYPSDLVEPQETSLIYDLEKFIKGHMFRWNINGFGYSDDLYHASYHAVLYLALLPKLLNLRLLRCKTNEVHSYHILRYLESHGRLDRYYPYLSLKQALFLYRNIIYIERNSGRAAQFTRLIEKLLTDRNIPIAEYSVRHLREFDGGYYPEILARTKALNARVNAGEQEYRTIDSLFGKEEPLVYGNKLHYLNGIDNDKASIKNHNSSVIQTKDLESSMVDYADAVPDTLESVLLTHWAYMANNGLYEAYVNFKDPASGETHTLSSLDAFIYMLYIQLKSVNINIREVPLHLNMKRRRHPKATLEELLSVVPKDIPELIDYAKEILEGQDQYYPTLSNSSFFEFCHDQYMHLMRYWYIVSNVHDLELRAYVKQMVLHMYCDELIVFKTDYTDIDQWILSKNLPSYDYSYEQAQELVKNIYEGATGLTVDQSKVLKNIQQALINLMSELSSYSVQFIREINDSEILPLNWTAVRTGKVESEVFSGYLVSLPIRVLEHDSCTKHYNYLDIVKTYVKDHYVDPEEKNYTISVGSSTILNMHVEKSNRIRFDSFRASVNIEEV